MCILMAVISLFLAMLSCQKAVAISDDFSTIQPDANILLQTRSAANSSALPSWAISGANCLPSPSPLAQVLILTINSSDGEVKRQNLKADLAELGIASNCVQMVYGWNAQKFDSEQAMMEQARLPARQQAEWMNTTLGYSHQIHGKMDAAHYPANGALACSLGHYEMWKIAAKAPPGQWSLILEDDARVQKTVEKRKTFEKLLLQLPKKVDLAYFDERHCECFRKGSTDCSYSLKSIRGTDQPIYGGVGSTAYAVTGAGARALLSERFDMGADYWLNVPVHSGKIKAFCPPGSDAIFLHNYIHKTAIWSKNFVKTLSEVLGVKLRLPSNLRN